MRNSQAMLINMEKLLALICRNVTQIFTCIHIVVSVQCCELFAVVPGQRVSSISMVAAHPQLVEISFRLHSEAGILRKHLSARPVLKCDQQFVVSLVSQPVDVL